MIANQVKGTGFKGTLDYLLGKEDSMIIGGNMIGETPNELAKEFSLSRSLKPNLKRAVYHTSLSLPHGEHLSNAKWKDVADEYVNKMGFKGSQYLIVKHNDTEHSHVHILASRIRLDGTVVSDSQDYKRSEQVVRGLEIKHNLTRTPSSREVGMSAPTKGELHKVIRENEPSTKMRLQHLINEVTQDRPDADIFAKRLAKHGIEVIPNKSKTGHISGISFEIDGERMKGSDLGRNYSWKNLTQRKLNYGEPKNQNSNHRTNAKEQQKLNTRNECRRGGTSSYRFLRSKRNINQRGGGQSLRPIHPIKQGLFGEMGLQQTTDSRSMSTDDFTSKNRFNRNTKQHGGTQKISRNGKRANELFQSNQTHSQNSSDKFTSFNADNDFQLKMAEDDLTRGLHELEQKRKERNSFKSKKIEKSRSQKRSRYFDLDLDL